MRTIPEQSQTSQNAVMSQTKGLISFPSIALFKHKLLPGLLVAFQKEECPRNGRADCSVEGASNMFPCCDKPRSAKWPRTVVFPNRRLGKIWALSIPIIGALNPFPQKDTALRPQSRESTLEAHTASMGAMISGVLVGSPGSLPLTPPSLILLGPNPRKKPNIYLQTPFRSSPTSKQKQTFASGLWGTGVRITNLHPSATAATGHHPTRQAHFARRPGARGARQRAGGEGAGRSTRASGRPRPVAVKLEGVNSSF